MKVEFTKEELKHIFAMADSDLDDGEKAIENTPKASLLHQEWRKCFKLDESIKKKCLEIGIQEGKGHAH